MNTTKTHKITIAVDIDDVLAANAEGFIAFSNERWGTTLTPEDYDEHWQRLWRVSKEETDKRAREFHKAGVVGTYRHNHEAKPVLQQLAKRYNLVITTSRRKELIKETTVWINKYFNGIFSEVHYAGIWDKISDHSHKATKTELCQQIGAEYLIDDQLKHCFAAADAGIEAILFGNYSWNQAEQLPKGVTRVLDWDEVLGYFNGKR